MLWGNAIYSVGALSIVAATTVRSYKFMIFGAVVQAFGDIATQAAQYKSIYLLVRFGFASTLGFELGIGKIGSFVGQATANVIAKNKHGRFQLGVLDCRLHEPLHEHYHGCILILHTTAYQQVHGNVSSGDE